MVFDFDMDNYLQLSKGSPWEQILNWPNGINDMKVLVLMILKLKFHRRQLSYLFQDVSN